MYIRAAPRCQEDLRIQRSRPRSRATRVGNGLLQKKSQKSSISGFAEKIRWGAHSWTQLRRTMTCQNILNSRRQVWLRAAH